MIGAPGGGLDFAGQYAIVAPDQRPHHRLRPLRHHRPAAGRGYPGLIAAHARAIEALADRIAASIAGRPTS